MGERFGGFVGRRSRRAFFGRGFLFVLAVFLREKGVALADTADASCVEQHVLGASFGRRGSREVGPGTGVKVFELGELKLVFVQRGIFDLPNGVVQLAVEFDQEFELLFVEQAFASRERVTLGREDVTALVCDDVGIISACREMGIKKEGY